MKLIGKALIAGVTACLFAPMLANAGIVSWDGSGNDCPNFFGTDGFETCQISVDGEVISPVIAKYGAGGAFESAFDSVTQDDFDFDFSEEKSGSWSVSDTYDWAVDPGVRFWSVKAGPDFRLYWMVEGSPTACDVNPFNSTCLNLAQVVDSGSWDVSDLGGTSHVTLFNSHPPEIVPEPGSLMLVGLGLLGLGAARRKAKRG